VKFILGYPPRVGLKVELKKPEKGAPWDGVYTVVDTDDYNMVGFVVIENERGQYGIDARYIEPIEEGSDE
jgi:hypothetical protein